MNDHPSTQIPDMQPEPTVLERYGELSMMILGALVCGLALGMLIVLPVIP